MLNLLAWLSVALMVVCGVSGLFFFAYVVWNDFTMAVEEESRVTLMPPRIRLFVAAALVVLAALLAPKGSLFVWLVSTAGVVGPAWLVVPTPYRRWFVVASLLVIMGAPSLLGAL